MSSFAIIPQSVNQMLYREKVSEKAQIAFLSTEERIHCLTNIYHLNIKNLQQSFEKICTVVSKFSFHPETSGIKHFAICLLDLSVGTCLVILSLFWVTLRSLSAAIIHPGLMLRAPTEQEVLDETWQELEKQQKQFQCRQLYCEFISLNPLPSPKTPKEKEAVFDAFKNYAVDTDRKSDLTLDEFFETLKVQHEALEALFKLEDLMNEFIEGPGEGLFALLQVNQSQTLQENFFPSFEKFAVAKEVKNSEYFEDYKTIFSPLIANLMKDIATHKTLLCEFQKGLGCKFFDQAGNLESKNVQPFLNDFEIFAKQRKFNNFLIFTQFRKFVGKDGNKITEILKYAPLMTLFTANRYDLNNEQLD